MQGPRAAAQERERAFVFDDIPGLPVSSDANIRTQFNKLSARWALITLRAQHAIGDLVLWRGVSWAMIKRRRGDRGNPSRQPHPPGSPSCPSPIIRCHRSEASGSCGLSPASCWGLRPVERPRVPAPGGSRPCAREHRPDLLADRARSNDPGAPRQAGRYLKRNSLMRSAPVWCEPLPSRFEAQVVSGAGGQHPFGSRHGRVATGRGVRHAGMPVPHLPRLTLCRDSSGAKRRKAKNTGLQAMADKLHQQRARGMGVRCECALHRMVSLCRRVKRRQGLHLGFW